jgi:hypothetical protein
MEARKVVDLVKVLLSNSLKSSRVGMSDKEEIHLRDCNSVHGIKWEFDPKTTH